MDTPVEYIRFVSCGILLLLRDSDSNTNTLTKWDIFWNQNVSRVGVLEVIDDDNDDDDNDNKGVSSICFDVQAFERGSTTSTTTTKKKKQKRHLRDFDQWKSRHRGDDEEEFLLDPPRGRGRGRPRLVH